MIWRITALICQANDQNTCHLHCQIINYVHPPKSKKIEAILLTNAHRSRKFNISTNPFQYQSSIQNEKPWNSRNSSEEMGKKEKTQSNPLSKFSISTWTGKTAHKWAVQESNPVGEKTKIKTTTTIILGFPESKRQQTNSRFTETRKQNTDDNPDELYTERKQGL